MTSFLTEPEPARGRAESVHPGVRRIVARNPSKMTYFGTNTYILDGPDGVTVLDPGPDDPVHVADVLREAGALVRRILLTHTHHDHLGATAALQAATHAPVYAYARPAVPGFVPDVPLEEGSQAAGLVALHTPGHAADHLCFAAPDGTLFSGDQVMSWSSSIVNPPGGEMATYFRSLERLLGRDDALYLPGHGPPLPQPRPFVASLLRHRQAREAAILAALDETPRTPLDFVNLLYSQIDPMLRRAAERNVVAHLGKLAAEGRAVASGEGWRRGDHR